MGEGNGEICAIVFRGDGRPRGEKPKGEKWAGEGRGEEREGITEGTTG